MKKLVAALLALFLLVSLLPTAFADSNLESVSAYLNVGITIRFNGDVQTMYDANNNRVYPLTYNGSTYLPVRAVSSMLSVPVRWDGTSNTVWLGEGEAVAMNVPDEKPELMANLQKVDTYLNYGITIRYNGRVQTMVDANGARVYPITYNGTTYLPVRAVSNLLSVNVNWDGANNTVWLGETAGDSSAVTRGTQTPIAYESKYLGLGFKMPTGWKYYTDKEIQSILGTTYAGSFTEELHASGAFCDMYASDTKVIDNVNIVLGVKSDAKASSFDAFCHNQFVALKEGLKKAYDFSIVTEGSLEVGSKTFYAIDVYGQMGLTELYQKTFLIDGGDYFTTITATAHTEEALKNVLDSFYLVK